MKQGAGNMWVQSTLSAGAATFTIEGLMPGTHMMNAVYLGDKDDVVTSSPSIRQVVAAFGR